MANVQEHIARLFPEATFEEGEWLLVNIPDAKWHSLAKTLKEDPELDFDYLVALVGMDWTETLGVMYYFTSTHLGHHVSVRVATDNREKPMLHSISDLWHVANLYEREVYDYFGIIFINHPDMRRLFLRNDWVGYPLRKDYDDSPEVNPVRLDHEAVDDVTYTYVEKPDGSVVKEKRTVFAPEDFVVNIGPQHPATHGVLRFRTAVDGETIKKIDVYMGYIHRGVEKLCEDLTYMQTLHFMDRLDYFSAHNYHHGLCLCIEKAAGIEVPRRAQILRVIFDELSRIASHCLFMGTFCMDLGATTMLFYTLRVREQILDIMEKTCGARMTFNYDVIGGVMAEPDPDLKKDIRALLDTIPANVKEYKKIFTGNVIAKNRMEGVGILSREDAISYAITGPSGRASGWACDVRKTHPYAVYPELKFEQVVREEGDSMARFNNRLDEVEQSAAILEQLLEMLPDEGEICAKVPKVLKLPQGHWFQVVEGCRGLFGVYIESDGSTKPFRLKLATPSLPAAAVVDHITSGMKIADLITIGGSMDYIVPDMDR